MKNLNISAAPICGPEIVLTKKKDTTRTKILRNIRLATVDKLRKSIKAYNRRHKTKLPLMRKGKSLNKKQLQYVARKYAVRII